MFKPLARQRDTLRVHHQLLACLSFGLLLSRCTLEKLSLSLELLGLGGLSGNISSIPVPWKRISLLRSPALGGHSGSFRGQALKLTGVGMGLAADDVDRGDANDVVSETEVAREVRVGREGLAAAVAGVWWLTWYMSSMDSARLRLATVTDGV